MYSQSGNMHHGQTLSLVYTVCVCVLGGGGRIQYTTDVFVLERFYV